MYCKILHNPAQRCRNRPFQRRKHVGQPNNNKGSAMSLPCSNAIQAAPRIWSSKGWNWLVSTIVGGTDPDSGLDCSGFVQVVFKDAVGLLLPCVQPRNKAKSATSSTKRNSSPATWYLQHHAPRLLACWHLPLATIASCTPRVPELKFVLKT